MKDKIFSSIKKYLKNRKEMVVLDLNIKNYNKSNFYMALVFNKRIEKFKVMYIPIDTICEKDKIEDYVCYQFVNIYLVNYILETFGAYREKCSSKVFDLKNNNIDSYYLEINYYGGNDNLVFMATRYIPREFEFMFESLVILFEHVPNIMRELCNEILAVLNDEKFDIKYNKSLTFDLYKDDINNIFLNRYLNLINDIKVDYLERVNGKYFAIINSNIIIIEYINSKKILNLYCNNSDSMEIYFYIVLKYIREEKFIKFNRIKFLDNKYYLCYGYNDEGLMVIEGSVLKILEWKYITLGKLKFISEIDDNLIKGIEDNLGMNRKDIKRIMEIN